MSEIESKDKLIARVRRDGKEQSLVAHLEETSQLAEQFMRKINLSEIGKIMGLLHDFGKASKEFQSYLRSAAGQISPDEDDYVEYKGKKGKIDHSTAGAQLVYEKLANKGREGKILAQFIALAIASHHSGLIDCLKPDGSNEFERRIKKDKSQTHLDEAQEKLPEIEKQLDQLITIPIEQQFVKKICNEMKEEEDSDRTLTFKWGLLARFLLSCLLDADRLSTADFECPENHAIRNYGKYASWETLIERLESRYLEYKQKMAQMQSGLALEVNQIRAQVAQACLEATTKGKGIYQLTVPTGGGKTEASLRFALHHAQRHKMDRIFYVVPYTTIIDQNADRIREILEKEEDNSIVLEHHSNFVPLEDTRYRYSLLAENWDAPIVFTTQVQFLETLFGYGTRDARRMHQLANSVIIFDEVQTVPLKITHMFTVALRFLSHDCGSTILLCTATPPPLDNLPNEYRRLIIEPKYKVISDEAKLFQKLKRVEIHDARKPAGYSNSEVADLVEEALQEKGSVLVVVNTRRSAQMIYKEIKKRHSDAATYHLSNNMCPAHRIDILEKQIKSKLKSGEPVICVSTQLIEAGVDVDFGAVIRALAGLDSIVQSAGRCNRHGERKDGGKLWIVNLREENLDYLKEIESGQRHVQCVLDDFRENPRTFEDNLIGLTAITRYYELYYREHMNDLDYPVNESSSIMRKDNLFNLLSVNKLSEENYRNTHQKRSPDMLLRQSFYSANSEFRVIDIVGHGVIVPYEEGKQIIKQLSDANDIEKQSVLFRKAQRYSINLFDSEFKKLFEMGVIRKIKPDVDIYYLSEKYYSLEFGYSDEPVE